MMSSESLGVKIDESHYSEHAFQNSYFWMFIKYFMESYFPCKGILFQNESQADNPIHCFSSVLLERS